MSSTLTHNIDLLLPDMPSAEELLPWLKKIDATHWYTNFGPLNELFEKQFLSYFNSNVPLHITTVANCTVGLELALRALQLPKGAKVLIPAFTFIATALAVMQAELTPVLADVDNSSWLLTPAIAKRACEQFDIAAVMPVAALSYPHDTASWDQFTNDSNIPVIIDAAGSFGNQTIGNNITVVFSLHATKALGAGEGGVIISPHAELVEYVRKASNFGIEKHCKNRIVTQYGTNAKLSEYHAAAALASLQRWPQQQQTRHNLQRLYHKFLQPLTKHIMFQGTQEPKVRSIFAIRCLQQIDVTHIKEKLAAKGIASMPWYIPSLDKQPYLQSLPICGELTMTALLNQQLLGLPFHPFLSHTDIELICEELTKIITE